MSKELRKAIEVELSSLVTTALASRNQLAAAGIAKHIKEGVKTIAKKFVKQFPKPSADKKVTKPAGKIKKAAATKPARKALTKVKSVSDK